jgi:hypothetical protein
MKSQAIKVAIKFAELQSKSAPSKVDKYFKSVKEKNPDYSDDKAWATAWSIYCKYKNPGDESCHQGDYFKGRTAAKHPTKTMSVVFKEGRNIAEPFNIDVIRKINHEVLPVEGDDEVYEVDVNISVVDHQACRPLTPEQVKAGLRREIRVDVEYPVGVSGSAASSAKACLAVLETIGENLGYTVLPCAHGYKPHPYTP